MNTNKKVGAIDTSSKLRPKAVPAGLFKSACAFPDCIACTLASLSAIPDASRRRHVLSACFASLPNRDPAFIELCLHQLRSLVRSILMTPSSLAPTVTSPAHTIPDISSSTISNCELNVDSAPSPHTAVAALREAESDPRSPGAPKTPVSPAAADKQREVDMLVDAGLGEVLIRVVSASQTTVFLPSVVAEMAMNVLRDLALCNTRDELGVVWWNNGLFAQVFPSVLDLDAATTVQSSGLDLISSVVGTTSVGNRAPVEEVVTVIKSIVQLLDMGNATERVLGSLAQAPYQVTLLGITESQVEMYAPRWARLLQDKAMLALCTLVKANFDRPLALERIAHSVPDLVPTLTSVLGELPMLPPQYPETDVYTNALIVLILLLPHLPNHGSPAFAPTLSALTRTLDAHPDVIPTAFDTLDQYIPAQLLPKRLLDLVDRALASRSTSVTLLVHTLGQLASNLATSSPALSDQAFTLLGTRTLYSSIAHMLHSIRLPVLKSIRRGASPLPVLTVLPPLDSALVTLTRANRLPPSLPRLSLLADRFEMSRAAAHAAFSSKALAEASTWFGAAIAYAKALGRPVCGLMSSRVECLLGVVGREGEALSVAKEAVEVCSKEHGHFAATVRREERARRAVERMGRKRD